MNGALKCSECTSELTYLLILVLNLFTSEIILTIPVGFGDEDNNKL